MDKQNKQIIGGAILSYILIVVNALYGLVVTPFIVAQIGDASFGVYKTITAFAASLMVIDLGLGGTVQRYIANYRALAKTNLIGGFIYMILIEAIILAVAASFIIVSIYFNIDTIFHNGLTPEEIVLAKQLFIILGITIIFHLFENVFNGVLTGYGVFIISNGLRLFRILIRILGTFLLLFIWKSPLTLVLLDCALVFFLLVFELFYSFKKLHLRVDPSHIDKAIFRESLLYSLMMFLTALANQMNGNLDSVVIGAFMTSTDVAVYSIAIIIFGMFTQVACSISSVLLPKVSFLIKDGVSKAKDYVISIGRIQFILLGAIFGAFLVLGKDFICLWMGKSYLPAYYVVLILMGPSILELCVNVCLTILRAVNKLKFKTFVTIAMAVFNSVFTIVGIKFWGYYAAAIATALSYFIGSVLLMNIYYHKEFKFNMMKFYLAIFSKILPCIILSSTLTYFALNFLSGNLIRLLVGSIVYVSVYVILLYFYGLNVSEKAKLDQILKNLLRC